MHIGIVRHHVQVRVVAPGGDASAATPTAQETPTHYRGEEAEAEACVWQGAAEGVVAVGIGVPPPTSTRVMTLLNLLMETLNPPYGGSTVS